MSKVLSSHKQTASSVADAKDIAGRASAGRIHGSGDATANAHCNIELGALDYSNSSSIIQFLAKEQDCNIDADPESIFQEVNRLSDNTDMRSVDELLLEAERLIQQQLRLGGSGDSGSGDGDGEGVVSALDKLNTQPLSPRSQASPHSINSVNSIRLNTRYTRRIEHVSKMKVANGRAEQATPLQTPSTLNESFSSGGFANFVENLADESVISQESMPMEYSAMSRFVSETPNNEDDDDDDTMEEITEVDETANCVAGSPLNSSQQQQQQQQQQQAGAKLLTPAAEFLKKQLQQQQEQQQHQQQQQQQQQQGGATAALPAFQMRRSSLVTTKVSTPSKTGNAEAPAVSLTMPRQSSPLGQQLSSRRGSSSSNNNNNNSSSNRSQQQQAVPAAPIKPMAKYSEKGVGSSPKHMVSTLSSPIEQVSTFITREHALKHEIEQLQELLKDTEERLASVRVQNDSLSQMQRTLRDQNARLLDESEMLKLDVQHLNECANMLRSELQAARKDRSEALHLHKSLNAELEEAQLERKRAHEHKEKDARIIQDLQRQCREMERILMRKHPDSVSALIVASKNPGICALNDQENLNSRKLLEQRIAQLESDAKDQDLKAQQILANVQARFHSVQAKYETHIADLETQVLSLQEINTKLNEQIESQVRTLDRYMQKRADKFYNNCTQTDETAAAAAAAAAAASGDGGDQNALAALRTSTGTQTAGGSNPNSSSSTRDHSTNTIGCPSTSVACLSQQHSGSSSTSSTANSTPNTSRPNSKQSGGLRRPAAATASAMNGLHQSKLPISHSESTLSMLSHGMAASSASAATSKEEGQMLSSVRSMRMDLAIKNKAMQRLTRELDDCKKTIRKLQRDRDSGAIGNSLVGAKCDGKQHSSSGGSGSGSSGIASASQRRTHDYDYIPATTENQALREAQNKYRLLEADYKTLHDKRLHDLKTLQSAHERELASCNETVRILQQRLNEREEAFAMQKRRKVPVDYYALKAKVSLLERRHSEREERLHMLVEALSKGRLNGALEDLLQENNNK